MCSEEITVGLELNEDRVIRHRMASQKELTF